MKKVPALDFGSGDVELLYAALDDFGPIALEERDSSVRAFFRSDADRDTAYRSLTARFAASPVDVPDDDWARRSQEDLRPVTVGRITVVPEQQSSISNQSAISNLQSAIVVIRPSMGFGTGHHATTRLCLEALQAIDLDGKSVLDVGTGSGVLAIAARVLGAAHATGIDVDPDAIQSARENLALNPQVSHVSFAVADLVGWGQTPDNVVWGLTPYNIVTANLTGALLTRAARQLLSATASGGTLVLSGILSTERHAVVSAFGSSRIVWERAEDEWVGLAVKKP